MKRSQFEATRNKFKNLGRLMICLLLAAGLADGCKPKPSAESAGGTGYFQTSFQDESQFIVEAIVSDLAEQMYYAAFHRLPDQKSFSVTATEKPGSPPDAPVYGLQIHLDPKQSDLKLEHDVNGPIWSPAVYQGVATQLAKAVGLSAGQPDKTEDTTLLVKLTDGTPETIERENQKLSAALERGFTNPELHEEAAVLLGAFLLRDHSGHFFEIRSPLSRLTAHLTMARWLRGSGAAGINGQMAEAMMLSLVGDEALSLERLNAIDTHNAPVAPMVRALRARNTGDYRPLDKLDRLSPSESVAWFSALSGYVSTTIAWQKLSDDQKQTIDYVRVANANRYSVEIGHQLLDVAIPLELKEANSVYELTHQQKASQQELMSALNAVPEHCLTRSGGEVQVRVIGWGQWASFLQRHLCQAVQQNVYFMSSMWGVPDEAKQFADQCDQYFDGLRLYPFVQRFKCTDVKSYHNSVDDGFKVTVATPQLVPSACWNQICYDVWFASRYNPNPNPHVNEWHNHNPPPGTLYDLNPRLNHTTLIGRTDAIKHFEQLHEMAPYDGRIVDYLMEHKYTNNPSFDQATDLNQAMLPYGVNAKRWVAHTLYDQPQQYEKIMLEAAALDPVWYYDLGGYAYNRKEEDRAAQFIEQGCAADPDGVRVANHGYERVVYFLKKGQIDKARQIADEAGEAYSALGLQAKATFFEKTTNYDGAFEWFAKIEERYSNSTYLVFFCDRYKNLTGDTRFVPELIKRLERVFPNGAEKVAVADFHRLPTDGVLIQRQSELLTAAGLQAGDVIVALNGTRTHTFLQYVYVRSLMPGPELDLIVCQRGKYHEIKCSPPQHLFGSDFVDYQPR
ncbi:MAG: hypothetical protein JWR19_2699 [Pedosphaera sp.]|nr:hypothetical protein [Pedosphaera sp.]